MASGYLEAGDQGQADPMEDELGKDWAWFPGDNIFWRKLLKKKKKHNNNNKNGFLR